MKAKKIISVITFLALVFSLAACSSDTETPSVSETETTTVQSSGIIGTKAKTSLPQIDMTKWQYEADDEVYWQTGISYCETPADENYETLGIFVPAGYFTATNNSDGTFTCKVNLGSNISGFTPSTAPIVIPVNTPGYSAMKPPEEYEDVSEYTDAGFIYVHAGCRGRDAGAPAGVTDLKAAIRYIRYNNSLIPGSSERIFTFGMSGGGAQSAVLGCSGDSALYTPYLEAIGAVKGVSDSVLGSMCWCPITNLDVADAAYEWNLGSARTDLSDEEQAISDGLSASFAEYINNLKLRDENGTILTIERNTGGTYQSGTYYDYIKSTIEKSLNNFLADTEFPHEVQSSTGEKPGEGFDGKLSDKGEKPGDDPEKSDKGSTEKTKEDFYSKDNIVRNDTNTLSLSGTYETPQDYIEALNSQTKWVEYDPQTNTASILSVSAFVSAMKQPSKDVGAFDALDRSQGENELFGCGDGGSHFDAVEAEILKGTDYENDFSEDLAKTDFLGNTVSYRVDMYNPMYFLCDCYDGVETSNIAKYFRIRTGIEQGDTALCTEVDLTLALIAYGSDVDFETVWGCGHTQAERTGQANENFINWVNDCLKRS